MVSYFVRYQGVATDPVAFTEYYAAQHAAILKRFPAINSLILHTPQHWTDPFQIRAGGAQLLAQMTFDDADALNAALASEARKDARADFSRFPPFSGEVTHQAMKSRVIF